MLSLIRRFGIQIVFVAMLCACGTSGEHKSTTTYTGEIEESIPYEKRAQIAKDWEAVLDRTEDEIEVLFPGVKRDNSVVEDARKMRVAQRLEPFAKGRGITIKQLVNIVQEIRAEKRGDYIPSKEERQAKKEAEQKRPAIKEVVEVDKKDNLPFPKEKGETPEQKAAREEVVRVAKMKADAEAAIQKAAEDEREADRLLDRVASRDDLHAIIAKYPKTGAAVKAKGRLDKLDKK